MITSLRGCTRSRKQKQPSPVHHLKDTIVLRGARTIFTPLPVLDSLGLEGSTLHLVNGSRLSLHDASRSSRWDDILHVGHGLKAQLSQKTKKLFSIHHSVVALFNDFLLALWGRDLCSMLICLMQITFILFLVFSMCFGLFHYLCNFGLLIKIHTDSLVVCHFVRSW